MNRRNALAGIGTVLTASLAGCLGTFGDGEDSTDPNESDSGPSSAPNESVPSGADADDYSIDGRFHNEADDSVTFAVTIRDEADEAVVSEEVAVAAGETERVPALGRPNEPRTFEIAAGGVEATETFQFHVDDPTDERPGFVDVTYTTEGAIEITFDDSGRSKGVETDSVPVLEDVAISEETTVPNVEREDDMDPWGVFVASRDVATRYFEPANTETPSAVATFVEETAFDDGERLLFVEAWGSQTCYDLQLDSEPRIGENGLTQAEFDVTRTAPEDQACGDAMTAVHLLLRLSYDPDGPDPDVVSIRVGGEVASPREFEVEADR